MTIFCLVEAWRGRRKTRSRRWTHVLKATDSKRSDILYVFLCEQLTDANSVSTWHLSHRSTTVIFYVVNR